jgi:hypothetical protein
MVPFVERQSLCSNFRLEYDGELTGYMPHDASSELVKSSLDALSSIGEVSVTMIGPDSQVSYLGGYVHFGSWYIASSCG